VTLLHIDHDYARELNEALRPHTETRLLESAALTFEQALRNVRGACLVLEDAVRQHQAVAERRIEAGEDCPDEVSDALAATAYGRALDAAWAVKNLLDDACS
jgi:hypothetical protein